MLTCLIVSRRLRLSAVVVAAVLGSVSTTHAAAPQETASHGSSSALRQDALRSMPLHKLTPQGKALVDRVLNDVTVFRRLPTQVIECDAEMHVFLVDNPDVVINMWEVMDVTKVTMQRLSETGFKLDDGAGTTGNCHYLYRSPSQHLAYCEGTFVGTMFPRPIRGRCVISMRSVPVRDAYNRNYVQCRLDTFVQIDNVGVELFAKTFQNQIGQIADHNFRETTAFVSNVSRAAEAAPENIHRIAAKLHRITPEAKRQLTEIGDRISAAAAVSRAETGPQLNGPGIPPTAQRPPANGAAR